MRLEAAAKLLGQYHSAQKAEMDHDVPQSGGSFSSGQGVAPKYPVWGYRCGEAANFAFRTLFMGCGARGFDKAGGARPGGRPRAGYGPTQDTAQLRIRTLNLKP